MYEYRCKTCGNLFERLSWGNQTATVTCACGSETVERIWFSRVAVGVPAGGHDAGPCSQPEGCCGGGACQIGEA